MPKEFKRELRRIEDGRGSCVAWIALRDGKLRVERFDCGPGPQEMLGGDYEHWVEVAEHALPELAYALLAEKLFGNLRAVDEVAALCKQHGIEYKEGSWS